MKIKRYLKVLFPLVALGLFIFSESGCSKEQKVFPDNESNDQEKETATLNVSLESTGTLRSTFESINIDIQEVSIHTSTDSEETTGWFILETNIGVYDLLDYAAGNDTILALDPMLEMQTVSQVRLVLGEENTIIIDGEIYDLEIPSGQMAGIKVQVHAELQPGMSYKVILEFDPENSIIETNNGKFILKPIINTTVVEL